MTLYSEPPMFLEHDRLRKVSATMPHVKLCGAQSFDSHRIAGRDRWWASRLPDRVAPHRESSRCVRLCLEGS